MKAQRRRQLAHGSNATILTVLVVLLVAVLVGVAERNPVRIDLSADAGNRLQEDTVRKLELLDDAGVAVEITAFSSQQGKRESYFKNRALKDFLEELDYQSSLVNWRLVDFDRERLTAESLGVTQYGHMVIQRGEDRVDLRDRDLFRRAGQGANLRMEFLGEAAFARAASQLLTKRKKVIYSLRGHGELDLESREPGGLSDLVVQLDMENYALEPLDLYRENEEGEAPAVPEDAAALLIARPQGPLTSAENDAVLSYISEGGSVMIWVDPGMPTPLLLEEMWVEVKDGVAMDRVLIFPHDDRPVPRYRAHAITSELADQNLITVLDHIAPLAAQENAPGWIRYRPLLETSRQGWIERGGETDGGKAVYQPEWDGAGPATMAFALEIRSNENGLVTPGRGLSRVVVVGDSAFASNQLLGEGPGNVGFLTNAFRWLLKDDMRLSTVGRPTRVRRLALTAQDQQVIRWLALGFMPMLTLLAGAAVWTSRRGR